MIKKLSEITRGEWIASNWIEVTTAADPERVFVSGHWHTPDECARAEKEWDTMQAAKAECQSQPS